MSILVTLICLVAVGELARAGHPSDSFEWALFKRQHRKSYSGSEDARRFANFLRNEAHVESHNANSTHSYKLGLNHMADWSEDEFGSIKGVKKKLPLKRNLSLEQESFLNAILNDPTPVPDEVDWRKAEARLSAVGDQGQCHSGWAFATTGVLEGQQVPLKLAQDEVVKLSEQELIDCLFDNYDCTHVSVSVSFVNAQELDGIMREKDYPYAGVIQPCMLNASNTLPTNTGTIQLTAYDEEALKRVVARYGPVAVGLISTTNMRMYRSGVLNDELCKNFYYVNHSGLLVGYGTDPKAGDFWIVKNSWSSEWGEEGYMKIARGSNMCEVAVEPTIAYF